VLKNILHRESYQLVKLLFWFFFFRSV